MVKALGFALPLPFLLVGEVVPPVTLMAMGMRSSKWTSSIQGANVGLYLWETGVLRSAFSKSPLSPHSSSHPVRRPLAVSAEPKVLSTCTFSWFCGGKHMTTCTRCPELSSVENSLHVIPVPRARVGCRVHAIEDSPLAAR